MKKMQNITTILAETGDLFSISGPQTGTDLNRIASALERIASSLEKLTTDKKPEVVEAKIEQTPPKIIPDANGESNLAIMAPTPLKQGVIEKYLAEHGAKELEQTKIVKDKDQENKLNQLATYIGQHFPELKEFYQFLKQKVQIPKSFLTYSIKEKTPTQIATIKSLCENLKNAEILEAFSIRELPDKYIELRFASKVQNYLTGGWFERYIERQVKFILRKNFPGDTLRRYRPNIKVSLKNGTEVELDFLFAIKNTVFCIETKTNTDEQELKDYLNRIQSLELQSRLLIVVAEKTTKDCGALAQKINGVKVANLDNLEKILVTMINTVCDTPKERVALG
jgi:hypothetical protein